MKITLAMVLSFCSFIAFSQSDKNVNEKDVPASVKDFIKKTYPQAEKIKYYIEQQGDSTYYEITFKHVKDEYTLMISANGQLYETEVVMKYEELPASVREKIAIDLKTRFERFSVTQVEKVNPDHELKYKVNIHGKHGHNKGYFDVYYERDGNFISEEQKTLKSIPSNSGF